MDSFVIISCLIGIVIGLIIALIVYNKEEKKSIVPFSIEALDMLDSLIDVKSKELSLEAIQWLTLISDKSYEIHRKASQGKYDIQKELGI